MSGSDAAATPTTHDDENDSVTPPITKNGDEKIVKLPTISFGYYYGRGLNTMHTSIMVMLSGCQGERVVECVNGRTIERKFDLSESLLLDADGYNRLVLGRPENCRFMEAFRNAASEKAETLTSFGDGYPTVVALSAVEGEQGVDPVSVCEDLELHVDEETDNPCVFSRVELTSGAIHSEFLLPLDESTSKLVAMPLPVHSVVLGATERNSEIEVVSNDEDMRTAICSSLDDSMLTAVCAFEEIDSSHTSQEHALPTTIEIPSAATSFFSCGPLIYEQLAGNEPIEREEKQASESADPAFQESVGFGEEELSEGTEIIHFLTDDHLRDSDRDESPSRLSLFLDSWNYPSSMARSLDEGP